MLGAALVAVLPASGARQTIELGWSETASAYGDHLVATFRIERLVVEGRRWAAALTISSANDFVVDQRSALIVEHRGRRNVLAAQRIQPPFPATLGREAGWSGVLIGEGPLPRGSRLRLRLGAFRLELAPVLVLTHVTRRFRYR